jgi:hypothetical protein
LKILNLADEALGRRKQNNQFSSNNFTVVWPIFALPKFECNKDSNADYAYAQL